MGLWIRTKVLVGRRLRRGAESFDGSASYWEQRYESGRDSGPGSYGRLAEFKAKVLNELVLREQAHDVVEWGCGDGNQLTLARYPSYVGIDVSHEAVSRCRNQFDHDETKVFLHRSEVPSDLMADVALSLDVVYHLVEDGAFDAHLDDVFSSARSLVVFYTSDLATNPDVRATQPHVRHRDLTTLVAERYGGWRLRETIPNLYPFDAEDPENTSWSDFFVYEPTQPED